MCANSFRWTFNFPFHFPLAHCSLILIVFDFKRFNCYVIYIIYISFTRSPNHICWRCRHTTKNRIKRITEFISLRKCQSCKLVVDVGGDLVPTKGYTQFNLARKHCTKFEQWMYRQQFNSSEIQLNRCNFTNSQQVGAKKNPFLFIPIGASVVCSSD